MINREELIDTIEYITLRERCRISRCRYNRVRLSFIFMYFNQIISLEDGKIKYCVAKEVSA